MMAHIMYDNVEHWCNIHQRNQHFFSLKAQNYVKEGKLEFAIRNQDEAAGCYRLAWTRLAYLLNVSEDDEMDTQANAQRFGKKVVWTGPVVFGVGYVWCGKIWFEEQKDNPR